MAASFKDHFSENSAGYATFRPGYPAALFSYLASMTQTHDRAWDCATGNGQSALNLTDYYAEVTATDASRSQINNATPHNQIRYRVAPAEKSDLETASVDLITVAQALHWFDMDLFSKEVSRVLKPGGILAVWTYNLMTISETIDDRIYYLYEPILGSYWPKERALVESGYKEVKLPFTQIQPPAFHMSAQWDMKQITGYLNTWSAVKRYQKQTGKNPVNKIYDDLLQAWGDPETPRLVKWPLNVRLWKNNI